MEVNKCVNSLFSFKNNWTLALCVPAELACCEDVKPECCLAVGDRRIHVVGWTNDTGFQNRQNKDNWVFKGFTMQYRRKLLVLPVVHDPKGDVG